MVALDIFVFALITIGGAKRNETISSAAWSLEQDGKLAGRVFRPLIDFLFSPFESNHCGNAWANEGRKP